MLPLLWLVSPLVLGGVRGQGEVCSLYTEGVQCQDAQKWVARAVIEPAE